MSKENKSKIIMLNEFEKQLEVIFNNYFNNTLSYDEFASQLKLFKDKWRYCRVDLKNYGTESNSLHFLEYNKDLNLVSPAWFCNKEGKGYKVGYDKGNIFLKLHSIKDGELKITMRGTDYTGIGKDNLKIPVYILYSDLLINDASALDEPKLLWHNDPFTASIKCKNEEEFNINIQFKTVFNYYPLLKSYLTNLSVDDDLHGLFDDIKQYISCEKLLYELDNE